MKKEENESPVKKKKHTKKDPNAPNRPVNPFMLYLRMSRENKKLEYPDTPVPEITKLCAADWMKLSEEEKKPFVEEAGKLREKYHADIEAYKSSEGFKKYQEGLLSDNKTPKKEIKEKMAAVVVGSQEKRKRGRPRKVKSDDEDLTPVKAFGKKDKKKPLVKAATAVLGRPPTKMKKESAQNQVPMTTNNIKIFTDEFLQHNKERETELRQLRKLTTEFEEQNAILSKHIDNMKAGEAKLTAEMAQMKERNEKIEGYYLRLRQEFVKCFASTAIPGTKEYPTEETMESFLDKLQLKLSQPKAGSPNDVSQGIRDRIQEFLTKFAETVED
jgi:hypothetical protein